VVVCGVVLVVSFVVWCCSCCVFVCDLIVSFVVWCCSCCVFVCVTCFSSYTTPNPCRTTGPRDALSCATTQVNTEGGAKGMHVWKPGVRVNL